MSSATAGHPHRPSRRMPRIWNFTTEYLLLLPIGAAVALLWANVEPESYFRMTLAIEFWVNEVAMVLFFGLIMKEVAEATVPGGVLHPWRRALLPLVASVGLTVLPLLAFSLIVPLFDEPRVVEGWPVVFATDLAAGYVFARLIFGRHAVIPFFLLLAICANALGVVALAMAEPASDVHLLAFALLMAIALAVVLILRRSRVRSFWPYVLVGGTLSWCALYFGGFEPALALIPIVPFLPHAQRDPGFFVDASPDATDALSRFERWCKHPAQGALFLFGLVNAGFQLHALYWGTLSLPIALFVAKPIGLLVGTGVARAARLHLPRTVGWRDLVVLGFIAAIGFTVALFFATAAVAPGPTLSEIKMGALVSVAGGLLAVLAAALLGVGRFGGGAGASAGGRS
jgi:NhaA family Na+:H+ antiporter